MGRVFFAAIIVGGLVLSSICFGYSGGSGTAEEPYQIANKEDLLALAGTTTDYNKCFILTADIDLDPNLPSGRVFTTAIIGAANFTGTFDGDGHKITNFIINGRYYLGLFGRINAGGAVKNLGLENFTVSGSSGDVGGLAGYNYYGSISNCYSTGTVSGDGDYIGGLVGYNDYGSISDCYSTGAVSGSSGSSYVGGLVGDNHYSSISNCYSTGAVSSFYYVGGLVGYNDRGSISDCYSTGAVSSDNRVGGLVGYNYIGSISNCYSTGAVSGSQDVGGLVGENHGANISNCYSTGSVIGTSYVGGLVGYNGSGSISDCYSTGAVSGTFDVGGLVGCNSFYGSISDCYSTGAVSGNTNVGGLMGYNDRGSINNCYFLATSGPDNGYGEPLTDEQMKQQASFTGWDFTTIWAICEGTNYPRLRWQIPLTGDFVCPDGVDFDDFAVFANQWLLKKLPADVAPGGGDGIVNFIDYAVFADGWQSVNDMNDLADFTSQWLKPSAYCADIAPAPSGDGVVNMLDLAIFAQHWLEGL